jgi:pentatricopeptide repeat protein
MQILKRGKVLRRFYTTVDISIYRQNPFKYFEEVKDDPKSYQTAIEICKLIQDPVDASLCALKYFHRLTTKPFEIPSATWETLINLFSKTKFYEQIYEIYEIMKVKSPKYGGFTPDTWTNLVQGLAEVGRISEIRHVMEHMKSTNVEPTLSTYHAYMSIYAQNRDVESVLGLMNEMKNLEWNGSPLEDIFGGKGR